MRDRQREWCPRCHGALLSPQASQQWIAHSAAPQTPQPQSRPRSGGRLPSGYRWIAVRPGAGPPPGRRRRPLGPTPRYAFIPRWGLVDPATQASTGMAAPARRGPSLRAIRATLITTVVVLGVAALLHIARYALLIDQPGSAAEFGRSGAGDLVAGGRERGRHVRDRRLRVRVDGVADRQARRGVRPPQRVRPAARVGAAGGMPCAAGEFGVGAHVPRRAGHRRGPLSARAPADLGVVVVVRAQHAGVGVRDRDELSQPTLRASPTTPSASSSPT